jgi:hypothetical protein
MHRIRTLAAATAATAVLAGSLAATTPTLPASATSCGTWRWPVKTGTDATRYQVHSGTTNASIGWLDSLTPPSASMLDSTYAQDHRLGWPSNQPWPEFRFWQLNGVKLIAVKLEDDGDYHLRLQGPSGPLMIGEVPQPSCASGSLWLTGIESARAAIYTRYPVSLDYWTYINRIVDIRGIGFFDNEHGVTGAAPNDIELHPVTHIYFH